MKIIELNCPNCDGPLQVSSEKKQMYCRYCGTKIIIDDVIKRHESSAEAYEEAVSDEDESERDEQPEPTGAVKGKRNNGTPFLLIGLALFVVIAIFLASSKSDSAKNGATSTDAQLEIAESKEYHDLAITITDMKFARHNGNLKYENMVDSEKINCCVYANVENQGKKTIDLTNYDVRLVCDGIEYEQLLIDNSEFLFYHQTIAPNETLKGKVIDFQIPRDQQNSDSQIYISIISPDGQKTIWNLR